MLIDAAYGITNDTTSGEGADVLCLLIIKKCWDGDNSQLYTPHKTVILIDSVII
jgi:hypothetical protein